MTFAERKDRVLLVITVITALYFAGTYLTKLMMSLFSSLYIEGFPLSAEHLVAPVMLTSGLIILFSCLKYIFREYFTFANYGMKMGLSKEYVEKANESYLALLDMVRLCIGMTVVTMPFLFLLFYSRAFLFVILGFIATMFLVTISVLWLKNKSDRIIVMFRTLVFSKRAVVLLVWVLVATFTSFIALLLFLANVTETLTVTYDIKDQPIMQMDFVNKIPDYMTVTAYNENSDVKVLEVIPKNEFNVFFVEAVLNSTYQPKNSIERLLRDGEKKQSNYRNNLYKYKKSIDLTPYLREGRNFIEITFSTSELANQEKEYRIVNEISKIAGKIVVNEKEILVNL